MGEIEFDVEKIEKTYNRVEEMFEDMDKEFKRDHSIEHWIDETLFKGRGLFSYSAHYSLTHPHVLFMDFIRQIKWAYQRVVRGFDDRASWSIDYWLNDKLPEILLQLKENCHGIPVQFFDGLEHDENYVYSKESEKIAEQKWNEELDKMITGFFAAKQIDDYKYETEEEREVLELVFEN